MFSADFRFRLSVLLRLLR